MRLHLQSSDFGSIIDARKGFLKYSSLKRGGG